MDLEQAAHAAVSMMTQLLSAVSSARSRCEEALATVGTLATQLDTDRAALHHALTAVEEQMTGLAGSLSATLTDVEPKVASMAHAAPSIGQPSTSAAPAAGQTVVQELDAEAAALEKMGEQLGGTGSELEALVGSAEAIAQAALTRADELEEALRALGDEAEQRVSLNYASYMSTTRESSVERTSQVQSLMDKACVALLEDRGREWETRRRACKEVLDDVFQDMETHADALVTEALEACAVRVAQALAELSGTVALVEDEWLDLESSLELASGCLETTPPLPERVTQIAQTADRAVAEVVTVRDSWRRQGFGD